jgi:hypothetical protein
MHTGTVSLSNLLRLLDHWNDALALHVSATLRPDLILQEHARRARVDELVHRPDDVESVAISCVRVNDDGNAHRATDPFRDGDHFGLGEVAEVRHPELGGRHAVARDKRQRKACLLHQPRAQGIIDAWEEQRPFLFKQGVDSRRGRHIGPMGLRGASPHCEGRAHSSNNARSGQSVGLCGTHSARALAHYS